MPAETSTPRPWRLGPRATIGFDALVTLAAVAGSASGLVMGSWSVVVLSLAETLPLAIRRHRPELAFAAVAVASGIQAVTYDYPVWGQVAFPIALYSVARFGRRRAAWAALGVSLAATFTASYVWVNAFNHQVPASYREPVDLSSYVPYALSIGAIVVAAWALGTQGRIRQAYEAALVERGQRLAVEAEQQAVLAATEERQRIAREMHDVVAHGLSVVIVQADGARYAAEHDPAVATRTLETIASTGRSALDEMRRLLGLLRGSTDAALVPQPSLADLPALLADDLAQGRLVAELDDPLPHVGDGVALAAYRVVQESLTNVRKHAGPTARATVTVRVHDGGLCVAVVDDGHGASAAAVQAHPGLGLLGMRERVAVHGGTLEAGPAPGGGWAVRARIPT